MNRTYNTILPAVIAAFLLVASPQQGRSQQTSSTSKSKAGTAVQNDSTPGKIAKFNDRGFVTDSNITEDSSGKIGVGTTAPTSPLTVQGMIETTLGGYKFPDGTTQTTAALVSVFRDSTLKGDGTQASPLGVSVPLILNGQLGIRGIIQATNTSITGIGVVGNGGSSGSGVAGIGGNSVNGFGGRGVTARGGASVLGGIGLEALGGSGNSSGGEGVRTTGGDSNLVGGNGMNATGGSGGFLGGDGINAMGGDGYFELSGTGSGGVGVKAIGGLGFGVGKSGGTAIYAEGGIGVDGAARGLAGFFSGNVQVLGTLSKSGGSFKIDHPLDPENKYLSHSFVESPDMMNIYNGNITTDGNGRAVVELPDWFEALNKDFRYQLTVVGTFAQAIVAEEVKGNRFVIQTNAPSVKVSWQVTGIRQDAWANKNRIPVEEIKPEVERGFYLHPEAFGKTEERGVNWASQPELMREMKQRRLEAEQSRKPKQ